MRIDLRFVLVASAVPLTAGCASSFTPAYGYGPASPAGYPAPAAQPPGALAPGQPGASPGDAAVAFARARLSAPYCWGGTGPGCFDCSGLTYASWRAAGRAIPRTSDAQLARLAPVPMDRLQPGDILWRPGHVGIYAGDGWAIHAPRTGGVVSYQPADHFQRAVRP